MITAQTERVRTYIIQLLHGKPVAGQQLARALSPSAYTALLPTVWSLLNAPEADDVLAALLDHAISVPSKTPLKLPTVAFVGRLVLVRPLAWRPGVPGSPNPSFYSLSMNMDPRGSAG